MRAALIVAFGLAGPAAPQSAEDVAFMRGVFARLQAPSFAREIEFCGYVFRQPDGGIGATAATPGDEGGCTSWAREQPNAPFVASYHTHGEHNPDYDSEFPSVLDLQADFLDGIDGWIATPGGRLWFVDHEAREARLICGEACIMQDPDYDPQDSGPVAWVYTVEGLRARY